MLFISILACISLALGILLSIVGVAGPHGLLALYGLYGLGALVVSALLYGVIVFKRPALLSKIMASFSLLAAFVSLFSYYPVLAGIYEDKKFDYEQNQHVKANLNVPIKIVSDKLVPVDSTPLASEDFQYQQLQIEVEVDAKKAGYYTFSMVLYEPAESGLYRHIVEGGIVERDGRVESVASLATTRTLQLSQGNQTFTLTFPIKQVVPFQESLKKTDYLVGHNGPYLIKLQLESVTDESNESESVNAYVTKKGKTVAFVDAMSQEESRACSGITVRDGVEYYSDPDDTQCINQNESNLDSILLKGGAELSFTGYDTSTYALVDQEIDLPFTGKYYPNVVLYQTKPYKLEDFKTTSSR